MPTSQDIRQRFLAFFEARGHVILPSAPLVPENDPSVLFNTAGMQPLVPYLLGEPHPAGVRLTNAQKCVRTQDIDEVGDKTHDTFFEMLGNWSLGDYFKEDAIRWSYQFLTSKEEGLGLDPKRLYVTVFAGNADAPRDTEAFNVWRSIGIPEQRIYFLAAEPSGKEPNWWSPGDNGPCGPDSEMFYDVTPDGLGDMTVDEYRRADETQQIVEIWNDVFMEYEKKEGKVIGKLAKQNVDTGGGLERMAMAAQGKDNIFETDLFSHLMTAIMELGSRDDLRASRIVADHLRTAIFLIGDGVRPSNTDQGYILRRLLRRAVRY
ncbi:MAG: alanine--tRNA ligase-related protein, partial [Candidatus Moraniibacteriota bacterium]